MWHGRRSSQDIRGVEAAILHSARTAGQATEECFARCWSDKTYFPVMTPNKTANLTPFIFTSKMLGEDIRRHNLRDAVVKNNIRASDSLM